ncbi:hypothetical protein MOQ72_26890 [Saccharopolyspora sp. K220]|uniref:hypothetical protein n=1 Tax=Saccharopolyspora soli TaxID=2926618 RepID=UPI001F55E9FE|nr:hypothetical protein [Saccharopolyspora soli]MCI2421075.1 hypothetical protein [Saccharopolyspora soli]
MTAIVGAALVVGLPGAATAESVSPAAIGGDYNGTSINIRLTPINGAIAGQGNRGDGVTALCSTWTSNGYWILHSNNRTKITGWTAGGLLRLQYMPTACP